MRVFVAGVLAIALTEALGAQLPTRTADERDVRQVVERYMAARAAEDPAAVAALFTTDADQFTTGGEWRRGRDQIRSGTAESSRRNPGTRRIAIEAVRFVTRDVAIADGPYEISTNGAPPRRMWTTLVLVQTGDGWRISAIRNMSPTSSQ